MSHGPCATARAPPHARHFAVTTDLDYITLPDGRRLDVRITGPEGAVPLVFHHGTPGARTPLRAVERAAHRSGLRFVTTSRPGYGGSPRRPGRDVVAVVADTAAVLDAIGAATCVVAGWSGGGPHALACAARLAGVTAALVVSSVAPCESEGLDWLSGMGAANLAEFAATLDGETALRAFLEPEAAGLQKVTVNDIVASLDSLLPPVDRAVVRGEFGDDLAALFHEALRAGVDGWIDDDLAFTKPWGFGLAEIAVPTSLWQGTEDLMVPLEHGRRLAARIPATFAHVERGEGHLSIVERAVARFLAELAPPGH